MSWIAAAIGGSALIGAGTSLYASGQQADAAGNSLAFQQGVFGQNQANFQQVQANFKPYLGAGKTAVNRMEASYADPGSFLNTPDYKFGVSEGMNALQNSSAAKGGMLGGNFLRGAVQFGQDYGTNYLTRYRGGLQGIANMGVGAAGAAAGGTANYANSANMGAGQIGSTYNFLGGANASGAVGAANSLNSGMQNYLFMNALGGGSSFGGGYGGGFGK